MDITLETAALARALGDVAKVTPAKGTIPILGMVRLTAVRKGKTLTLDTTDLDIEVSETIHVTTAHSGGVICAPARTLAGIVGKLPKGSQVTLTIEDSEPDRLVITSPGCRFTLPTLPDGDFPVMDQGEAAVTLDLPARDLSGLLSRVAYAMCTEETRYYLNGIYLHIHDGRLRAVATDGHAMGVADGPALDAMSITGEIVDGKFAEHGTILPRVTLPHLLTALDAADTDDDVTLTISAGKLSLRAGTRRVLSKLIDGTFPDYHRVIPTDLVTTLRVDEAVLMPALARVGVCTAKSNAVRFIIDGDGGLSLSAMDPEIGTATATVDVDGEGPAIEIGFNHKYLGDAVGAARKRGVAALVLELSGPGGAAKLTSPDDPDALDIVMPLRV